MKEVISHLKDKLFWQENLKSIGQRALDMGRSKEYPYLINAVKQQERKCNDLNQAIDILNSH